MAKEQKQLLIVGYVAEAIPDLEKYLKPPVPPKNYGPEAAEKWLKEKGPERLAEAKLVAASGKLTGRMREIVAVDPHREAIFVSNPRTGEPASVQFLQWVSTHYSGSFTTELRDRSEPLLTIMGFDPKEFVRVVGTEAILHGGLTVPLGFWYMNESVFDPYDMLVESGRRDLFDIYSLLKLLDVPLPSVDWAPHKQALWDAVIAAELIYRNQLYPTMGSTQHDALMASFASLMSAVAEEMAEDEEAPLDSESETEQNEVAEAAQEEPAEGDAAEEVATAAGTLRRPPRRNAATPQAS
jgi:hypothetical protein